MRITAIAAVGVFALTGCLNAQKAIPDIIADWDLETFGVRIVRPGQSKDEVESFLGHETGLGPVLGASFYIASHYGHLVVRYNGSPDRVAWCETLVLTTRGGGEASFKDPQLFVMLTPGMAPTEVQERIGRPACGYTNGPGLVVTVHPQPGIEITYRDGRLKSWRRIHYYEPLSADSRPPLAQPETPSITD